MSRESALTSGSLSTVVTTVNESLFWIVPIR